MTFWSRMNMNHKTAIIASVISSVFQEIAGRTMIMLICHVIYRISWRVEETLVSLSRFTGASATMVPRRLSNLRAIEEFHQRITQLLDFARSYDKSTYRIWKRLPSCVNENRLWSCVSWFRYPPNTWLQHITQSGVRLSFIVPPSLDHQLVTIIVTKFRTFHPGNFWHCCNHFDPGRDHFKRSL